MVAVKCTQDVVGVSVVLADRIEQLQRELGLGVIDLNQLAGLSKSSLNASMTREKQGSLVNGLPGDSIFRLADTFMHNVSWFTSDGDYLRWNPEMVAAQKVLRKWARTPKVWSETPRQRLIATWEKLQEVAPSLREEIWATYLHWSECQRTGKGNETYVGVNYEDWRRCKAGEVEPGEMQIKGAAMLTGLPQKWFLTGDTQYLDEMDADTLAYVGRLIREHGWEPEDVVRMMEARVSLR
jgi:hypothetical protein